MLCSLLVVTIRVYLFSQRVVAPCGARLQNMLIVREVSGVGQRVLAERELTTVWLKKSHTIK